MADLEHLTVDHPETECDQSVKVFIFQASDPDYYMSHATSTSSEDSPHPLGITGYTPWIDFVLRLGRVPPISIAKIRGRARGIGNQFVLACDMRFGLARRLPSFDREALAAVKGIRHPKRV